MLIKRNVLDRIVAGEIDVQYRRWKRPTVAAGRTLRTAVGMLSIDSVDRTSLGAITAADARRAGFPSKAALVRRLGERDAGHVYRIGLHFAGDDPRIALREKSELSGTELADLTARLRRLDRAAKRGPWTEQTLRLLAERPHVRAEDLAAQLGLDKPTFKADVRKLKTLGLTISHSPGYELSPRGRSLLREL